MKPAEIDQIARDFEAQNPDIKVVMEYVGYDYIHDKIATGMAAKPPAYDASMIDVIWPDEFIKAGYLLDVTSRVTPDMKSGIFPVCLEWCHPQRQDLRYALVDGYQVLHVQQGHAAESRYLPMPPKTWEELVDQAKVIKQKGLAEFPIMLVMELRRKALFAISPFCCMGMADPSWMPAVNRPSIMKRASRFDLDETNHRRWFDQPKRHLFR